MATARKFNPARVSDKTEGRFPLRLIRLCLMELYGLWDNVTAAFGGAPGSPGSGGGPASELATRIQVPWCANGPIRVDTDVDGAWVVPTACEIARLRLWRDVAGSAGSTILDLKRNGSSLYATQANRPTILASAGNGAIQDCILPDVVSLAADDVITVDTAAKESGVPRNWRLTLEAA